MNLSFWYKDGQYAWTLLCELIEVVLPAAADKVQTFNSHPPYKKKQTNKKKPWQPSHAELRV